MNETREVPAMVDTALLLKEIQQTPKRGDYRWLTGLYAIALRLNFGQTDFALVNRAIIDRWSITRLKAIKRMAWKAVEEAETV